MTTRGWIVVAFRARPKLTLEEAKKIAAKLRGDRAFLLFDAANGGGPEPLPLDDPNADDRGGPDELTKVVIDAHYGPSAPLNEGGLPELYLLGQRSTSPGRLPRNDWTDDVTRAVRYATAVAADAAAKLCHTADYFRVCVAFRDGQGNTYFDRKIALWREEQLCALRQLADQADPPAPFMGFPPGFDPNLHVVENARGADLDSHAGEGSVTAPERRSEPVVPGMRAAALPAGIRAMTPEEELLAQETLLLSAGWSRDPLDGWDLVDSSGHAHHRGLTTVAAMAEEPACAHCGAPVDHTMRGWCCWRNCSGDYRCQPCGALLERVVEGWKCSSAECKKRDECGVRP